jgi:hypothetical protein
MDGVAQPGRLALLVGCLFWLSGFAAEEPAVADIALLEFLGSMEEEADEWEAFIDIATSGMPPMVAEVEDED